ncbi:unnamed protein product [Lampetra planeri]
MLTHHKHPTRHSSGEEDNDGNLVPLTAPGMAAPESPANASPAAEQHCAIRTADPSPSQERRVASARLADLLGATADLVGKLNVGKPSMEELGLGPRSWNDEMPLVFTSAFLSLTQAVFPKMEAAGIDSLVMDRLLGLAEELNVALPASEEDDPASLVIARCIQSHLGMKKCSDLVAYAAPADGHEPLEEDESAPVCAAVASGRDVQSSAPIVASVSAPSPDAPIPCNAALGLSNSEWHASRVRTLPS